MKPLPETFTKDKFTYTQVRREGDVAIYRQQKAPHTWERFEVGIVQKHDGYVIAGKSFEPAEFWPRSEDWGKLGWTYTNLSDAKKRMATLLPSAPQNA